MGEGQTGRLTNFTCVTCPCSVFRSHEVYSELLGRTLQRTGIPWNHSLTALRWTGELLCWCVLGKPTWPSERSFPCQWCQGTGRRDRRMGSWAVSRHTWGGGSRGTLEMAGGAGGSHSEKCLLLPEQWRTMLRLKQYEIPWSSGQSSQAECWRPGNEKKLLH